MELWQFIIAKSVGYLLGILLMLWLIFLAIIFLIYPLCRLIYIYGNKMFGKIELKYLLFPLPIFFRERYVQRNKEFKSNEKHIALIIANNWFPEKYLAYGIHIHKLIKYLKDNNKPYKVYDKLNSGQIKSIINNKKVKSVLIFGHGSHHSVQTSWKESLYYCELFKYPKKEFIAQFHCNGLSGRSLAEFIGKKDTLCFITDSMQNDLEINKQIKKIIRDGLL